MGVHTRASVDDERQIKSSRLSHLEPSVTRPRGHFRLSRVSLDVLKKRETASV